MPPRARDLRQLGGGGAGSGMHGVLRVPRGLQYCRVLHFSMKNILTRAMRHPRPLSTLYSHLRFYTCGFFGAASVRPKPPAGRSRKDLRLGASVLTLLRLGVSMHISALVSFFGARQTFTLSPARGSAACCVPTVCSVSTAATFPSALFPTPRARLPYASHLMLGLAVVQWVRVE